MVNILTFTDSEGKEVQVNAQELQTEAGKEWLRQRLKGEREETNGQVTDVLDETP